MPNFSVFGDLSSRLSQSVYMRWFVYQMRVSQASLIISFVSFILGSVALLHHYGVLHGRLMLGGLVIFYIGIMFSQHPSFTRVMPSPFASLFIGVLSTVWFLTYVFDLWFSWVFALTFVLFYVVLLLIKGGLGRIPLYWPNTFFLSGLVSLAIASYFGDSRLLIFPIASIVSLIRRVEGRQRPSYVIDIPYAVLLPIMTYFMYEPIDIAALSLLTLAAIGVPRRFGPAFKTIYARAYPIGSSLGRAALVITAVLSILGVSSLDSLHMFFIGFVAVIMSSLCIPMLIPGILWFYMRFYGFVGYDVPTLLFISALLRASVFAGGFMFIIASFLLTVIAYIEVAVSYLSGGRVKVL